MLGTHSRVGENSPVRRIRGCTPVISKIKEYLVDPEEGAVLKVLDNIHGNVKVTLLLSLSGGCWTIWKHGGRDRLILIKGLGTNKSKGI